MNNTPIATLTGPVFSTQYAFVIHLNLTPFPSITGYHTVCLRFVSGTDHFVDVDYFQLANLS
ncbi:MAG TPA: hypothetical protein VMB79_00555 [Jatrophihabitans sp.]|nr:hypothetical protein [Jatrophihabitans sp.]